MPTDDPGERRGAEPSGPVTFVNTFAVHGRPEEFEAAFAKTAEFLRRQPGLLQYTLLRHTEQPHHYLNVARWESADHLYRAVQAPEFRSHAAALRELSTSEPNLYVAREVFYHG